MPGKIDWIQLLILLVVFGGGIIRFIMRNLTSGRKVPDRGERVPRPKSPALEILDKLRQNEETIATRQAQAPSASKSGVRKNRVSSTSTAQTRPTRVVFPPASRWT